MSESLPRLRSDVQVSVHHEGEETYLVLHDVMGFADGPIMVHSDMLGILEVCDGETTWASIAEGAGVPADGPEMLQLRAFIGELDSLGYFETDAALAREREAVYAWTGLELRPPVCSGSTYPADQDELRAFLDEMLSSGDPTAVMDEEAIAYLIPHIDYRVSPTVYAPAFNALKNSTSDLFVMIGTSHYWADDRIILTDKHFDTPLGAVHTDRELVSALRARLSTMATGSDQEEDSEPSILAENDLAHKPEHSLELHAVMLRHVLGDRPITILPILVTGFGGEHDPNGRTVLQQIAAEIRDVVRESQKRATWLISGDLAHVGQKFGDAAAAETMLPAVQAADEELIGHLQRGDQDSYHTAIESSDHVFRVCGHAPTVLTLDALGTIRGQKLAYDVWNEVETSSAVTFTTMAFGGTVANP